MQKEDYALLMIRELPSLCLKSSSAMPPGPRLCDVFLFGRLVPSDGIAYLYFAGKNSVILETDYP